MNKNEEKTEDRPFMTIKEAAKYVQLSLGTVYNYVHFNKIPYWRTKTGRAVFRKEDLDAWMLSERVDPMPIV
ncbi:MAG: helix-turn-helix domain-containing protein [Bacteroidales bacterium]|nr:helix-turn-helix domain-containing protein [Bacteroidales bacterium]MBO7617407.1 helix-turn-helix domain-containing protein [Bacteroidales bacterium]